MSDRLDLNAEITLSAACRLRAGESLLILTYDDERFRRIARALAAAAVRMKAIPAVMDLTEYAWICRDASGGPPVLAPAKAAVIAADVTLRMGGAGFDALLGDPDAADGELTGHSRRFQLQNRGMEEWEISARQVGDIRRRTEWLVALLGRSRRVHVTSEAGTDFSFELGGGAKWTPVLGIVPLYGEVAIAPKPGTEQGIVVVDGPTQKKARPRTELDREPLRIKVDAGRAVGFAGDPEQVKRLREFIASGNPAADTIDEVGIVTTAIKANDDYNWVDGTHHHDCCHVALGNNSRRDTLIHGPKHMDGEVREPTIRVDGQVVVERGVFKDALMDGAAG